MRILVLGFNGYLGGHIAGQLRALGGVRLFGAGRAPTADLHIDLATATTEQLADALADFSPDAVVNCAGALGSDPVSDAEVNARGPAVLCGALRLAAPAARLVHLGSAAEYGAAGHGVRVTESSSTRPAGTYGATKLAGTVAVASSGLDAVVLRVGNPVGPGAPPMSLPGRTALRLLRAGTDPDAVLRLGELSAYRDFVDVRDVARAAVLATTVPGPLPRILNIGGGHAVPIRELVRTLADVAGFRGRIDETADAEAGSVRSAGVGWQCSDITAAREALGWEPRFTLADSLAALWASETSRPRLEAMP